MGAIAVSDLVVRPSGRRAAVRGRLVQLAAGPPRGPRRRQRRRQEHAAADRSPGLLEPLDGRGRDRRPHALHAAGRRHRRGHASASCCSASRPRALARRGPRAADAPSATSPRATRARACGSARRSATWSDLGGYELEGAVGRGLPADRRAAGSARSATGRRDRSRAASASGSCSSCCSPPTPTVLLLDEPDNFLDVPAKRALEERIRATKKTVLLISHDRELLSAGLRRDRHARGRRRLGPRRVLRDLPARRASIARS